MCGVIGQIKVPPGKMYSCGTVFTLKYYIYVRCRINYNDYNTVL